MNITLEQCVTHLINTAAKAPVPLQTHEVSKQCATALMKFIQESNSAKGDVQPGGPNQDAPDADAAPAGHTRNNNPRKRRR